MSNKFLNPSGETDLSDVIARVNGNTEAIQDHVADTANPHITSTSNIDPQPFTSDEVPEGATNRYLVQPFVGNFDMGGNQILNASVVGNPAGSLTLAAPTSAIVLDPLPNIGILAQSGTGQDVNIISDADCDIKNFNAGNAIRLSGDAIELNNQAGASFLTLDATEINSFKAINMNNNNLNNVLNINSGSSINLNPTTFIDCNGDIDMSNNKILLVPEIVGNGGDMTIRNGAGESILLNSATNTIDLLNNDLNMNNNEITNVSEVSSASNLLLTSGDITGVLGTNSVVITETATNMFMSFGSGSITINQTNDPSPPTSIALFEPTGLTMKQIINMNGNNITNAGDVALTSINTNIIYVPDGTMPSSFVADRTYIFEGTRTTATPIVLPAGPITIKGLSRENSTIVYTGIGALFTGADQNLTIVDLGWSCTNTAGYFLDATNAAKDKLLTIQNCEFREAYQVMRLEGYDLVDFQNNVITYIRSGALLPAYGITCINVLKLEINSCEFIRWYEFGQPANTNAFVGNMIDISGSGGATQITNNIIHPRVAQNGIDIDAAATFGAGVNITGNTFVDAGLTGGLVLQTNSNADYDVKGITEANTLLPNLKSRVGAQLSAVNTITTATSGTPADINLNNLLVAFDAFGVTVGTGGGVTYNRTRPVNFQVTFVANLQALTGGANQRVGLTVSKNGANTGINSFVNLDSAGTAPKSVTLTIIGSAVQGDVFRSQLVNTTTSSNITCTDLIVSGIEI
jgi:hypothetical protein